MNALEAQVRVLRILHPKLVGSLSLHLNGWRKLTKLLPERTSRAGGQDSCPRVLSFPP
jgi:hypothetical protein